MNKVQLLCHYCVQYSCTDRPRRTFEFVGQNEKKLSEAKPRITIVFISHTNSNGRQGLSLCIVHHNGMIIELYSLECNFINPKLKF